MFFNSESIAMKTSLKSLCLLMILSAGLPTQAKAHDNAAPIVIGAAVIGGTAALYVTGRCSSALLYAVAKRRFEAEMELLQRMAFKESVLEEELVPYILDCHEKTNQSFFFTNGSYKNYPLLRYKKDLDFYINYLWCLQLFRFGTETKREISTFLDKLKMIRRYIITDYRFIREQRQFDER